jgi:hypothetical protein
MKLNICKYLCLHIPFTVCCMCIVFLFHKFINLKIYSAAWLKKELYPIHIFLGNFRTSMENKYTLKFTFAIEIQIDKLFTLVLVTYE